MMKSRMIKFVFSNLTKHPKIFQLHFSNMSPQLKDKLLGFLRSHHLHRQIIKPECQFALSKPSKFLTASLVQLGKMVQDETLPNIIQSFSQCVDDISLRERNAIIEELDVSCCNLLDKMDINTIFLYLDLWMQLSPSRIKSLKFYKLCIFKVEYFLRNGNPTPSEVINSMFFIGLQKKSLVSKQLAELSLHALDVRKLSELNLLELCIVLDCLFKTGCKAKSKIVLFAMIRTLQSNVNILLHQSDLLIIFIKYLRICKYHDEIFLQWLNSTLMENGDVVRNMNFTAKVHVMTLFAQALCCNDLVKFLTTQCLHDISSNNLNDKENKKLHLTFRPRSKDLTRFLWCVSHLGIDINEAELKIISSSMSFRITMGELQKTPEDILESILSMWMLGYKKQTALFDAITFENIYKIRDKQKIRYNSRIALLLICIKIECPNLLTKEELSLLESVKPVLQHDIEKHRAIRNCFSFTFEAVNHLSDVLHLKNIQMEFCIPHLFIAGISAETQEGNKLHIDVLDHTTCLRGSESVCGLMKLKARLIKQLGFHHVKIHEKVLENTEEISNKYSYIDKEIRSCINDLKN